MAVRSSDTGSSVHGRLRGRQAAVGGFGLIKEVVPVSMVVISLLEGG
jgi:hypothetical protein